jgi:ankyrin repeat protein
MAAYAKPTQKNTARIPQAYQIADAITPADNTQIGPYMGFVCNVAGNIVVCLRNDDGTNKLTLAALAGVIYPIEIQGVDATGTTATGIKGLG